MSKYVCPICHERMTDPVIVDDGHIYDFQCIHPWVTEHGTSPLTMKPISAHFIRVHALQAELRELEMEEGLKKITFAPPGVVDDRPSPPSYKPLVTQPETPVTQPPEERLFEPPTLVSALTFLNGYLELGFGLWILIDPLSEAQFVSIMQIIFGMFWIVMTIPFIIKHRLTALSYNFTNITWLMLSAVNWLLSIIIASLTLPAYTQPMMASGILGVANVFTTFIIFMIIIINLNYNHSKFKLV